MALRNIIETTESLTDVVTTDTTIEVDLVDVTTLSIQAVIDVNTPAAKTFTDANITDGTDTIAIASHGFTTGLKAALTTDDVLPTGLSASNYYVIVVTSGTIQLASSLANALAGTKVATAADGSGTHTLTPTSIAGGSIKLQKSNDGTNWADDGAAQNVTADGSLWLEADPPTGRYARVYLTLTAGRLSADLNILAKG